MGKYEHVYQELASKIDDGSYPVGSLLPSEKQLTELYDVSRETTRKALALLTERGYIQKIMGKGSMVIHRPQYTWQVSSLVSYKEFAAQNGGRTKVFALEKSRLPVGHFKDLVPEVEPLEVTFIGRLRYLDGTPAIIDRDYVLTSVVPKVPRSAADDSLYEYFEQELGLTVAYSDKLIRVEPATEADRKMLKLAKGEYVAVTLSVTSLDNDQVVQYTESRHRADKFVYRDFARRN